MDLTLRRVRVSDLDDASERFGLLLEAPDGRSLLVLSAETREELDAQVELAGGPVALARTRGVMPLDPQGIAPGPVWVAP